MPPLSPRPRPAAAQAPAGRMTSQLKALVAGCRTDVHPRARHVGVRPCRAWRCGGAAGGEAPGLFYVLCARVRFLFLLACFVFLDGGV